MRTHHASEFQRLGGRGDANATARSRRPRWESWLAFLFIVFCAVTWMNNERVVAWLLSQGMVNETATRTAPSAVRRVAEAAGVLGLIAAWRIFASLALGVYRWAPVHTSVEQMRQALGPPVGAVSSLSRATVRAVTTALASLAHHLRRGAFAILWPFRMAVVADGRAVSWVLRYLEMGASTALGYLVRGFAFVLQGIGVAFSTIGQAVGATASYTSRTGAAGRGYLWKVVQPAVAAMRYAWLAAATGLGYLWKGVLAALRPIRLGVAMAVLAVSLAVRYAWRLAASVLDYFRQGVLAGLRPVRLGVVMAVQAAVVAVRYVSRAAATGLGYLWQGSLAALRPIRLGVAMAIQAVGVAARYAWRLAASVLDYFRQGVLAALIPLRFEISTGAQAAAVAVHCALRSAATVLAYQWRRALAVVRPIRLVVVMAAHAVAVALRHAWQAAATVLGSLRIAVLAVLRVNWLAVSLVVRAIVLIVRYSLPAAAIVLGCVWQAAFRPVRLGASTTAQAGSLATRYASRALVTLLSYLWQGASFLVGGLIWSLVLAFRTVRAGCAVVPDVWKTGVNVTINRQGVSAMSEFNLTRQRLLPLVVTVLVLFTAAAVLIRVFWPAPPEPTVQVTHWANAHLLRTGQGLRMLPVMADEFNRAGHRTQSGTRIVIDVRNVPSELQAEYLTPRVKNGTRVNLHAISDGYVESDIPDPTIVTPSDDHWMVTVNHEVGRPVVDLSGSPALVRPYIGIVTYTDMAECLGWPEKEIGYADIIALRADPQGWASYGCAEAAWGQRPLLAFTDPTTSSTGRSVLLALYSFAGGKPADQLTLDDVEDEHVVRYVSEFQGLIDHYMIGTTVLNTKIYQGPRFGHFFIMPEDNLIHLYEGTERAFINGKRVTPPPIAPGSMVMIYPKEGSMPRRNCACIVKGDWVTEEQVEAAQKWTAFLLEDRQQQSFMESGLRPGTNISLTGPSSKISSAYGLNPAEPRMVVSPSLINPAVAAAIDGSWDEVKRPGIVTFVVDTSGSMMGAKLQSARDGMLRALDAMARNNQVGFLTFGETVNLDSKVPVAPLQQSMFSIKAAVEKTQARGGTALYDAVRAGIEMADAADGDPAAIRGVVVLTDGRANKGETKLHDLIRMESSRETKIKVYDGREDSPPPVDEFGGSVQRDNVIGTGLVLPTRHPVQVFFIGLGEDADLGIGRVLAEATGAEFQGASEEDLAKVLEEFSKYF